MEESFTFCSCHIPSATIAPFLSTLFSNTLSLGQTGEQFGGRLPKLSIHLERIISRFRQNLKSKINSWSPP